MQMLTYKEWDAKEVAENLTFENRQNVAKNLSEDDYFDIVINVSLKKEALETSYEVLTFYHLRCLQP